MKFAEILSPRRQKIELTFPKELDPKIEEKTPQALQKLDKKQKERSEANDE